MGSSLRENLLEGRYAIGIHGLGFIGTSTAMAYAHEGVKSICYDINPKKVELYKQGVCDVMNLEKWSMMKLKPFIDNGMILPTNEVRALKNCPVHFIAVPTERNGKPYIYYIENVLNTIKMFDTNSLIVIESTLSPNWIKDLNLESLSVCVAPRRDWFADPNHNLKNLIRIYCGNNPLREADIYSVLSIVCDNLLRASSMRIASLTKAVENALWFIQLVAVQQLAMGYTDEDVNELLRLVATHPRLGHYYPNIKIGGYCVPLGAEYVLDGSSYPDELNLYLNALDYNSKLVKALARYFEQYDRIGIMGITYKNDLKVATLSPAIDLAKILGSKVKAHDPYFTSEEIKHILKIEDFKYPDDLSQFNALIILTDHKLYYETPLSVIKDNVSPETYIFDNLGVWEKHKSYFTEYHRFGDGSI